MEAGKSFWQSRRVAITGATGFIGHHLTTRLKILGAQVIALVRANSKTDRLRALGIDYAIAPLDEPEAMARAFSDCDLVFHLAGAVDFGNDWEPFQQANVQGTVHVLSAARSAGIRRLIHTSSIVAVGASSRSEPINETATWNLGRLQIPYVTTKREGEEKALVHAGVPEVVVVNPACVVGPDDFTSSEFGTLCKRFWRGRIPFYFGGGNNFVDVRDVAEGMLLAAEKGHTGERYILGGENLTYADFFALLEVVSGQRSFRMLLPNFVARFGARAIEALTHARRPSLSRSQARLMGRYLFFDCGKARRELGYSPRPLAAALIDAHQYWMKAVRAA